MWLFQAEQTSLMPRRMQSFRWSTTIRTGFFFFLALYGGPNSRDEFKEILTFNRVLIL